jgi:hypothetical protein
MPAMNFTSASVYLGVSGLVDDTTRLGSPGAPGCTTRMPEGPGPVAHETPPAIRTNAAMREAARATTVSKEYMPRPQTLEHNRTSRGEVDMKRVFYVFVASLAILALPAITLAGQAEKPKTITVMGTVTEVAPDSMTVKGKTESWTFTIDKETSVTAKGATTKTLELKREGKGTKLTDFVKAGDQVTVAYHDVGAAKHASSIRVTAQIK